MEEKHIEAFDIPSYHVDGNKNLRPSCFLGYAQEMAMNGANVLHFGFDDMAKYNLAWVISRTHLEFHKAPKWRDKVEFRTWHKGIHRVFFLRDYQLFDRECGDLLISGTSSWIVLDTVERRLFRTDRLSEHFNVDAQCQENAIETPADKIVIPAELPSELVHTHTVKYSDLDFIGHANNTAYVAWSMDCVPSEISDSTYIKELDINFIKETREGETIDLYRTIEESSKGTIIYIEGKVDGSSNFTAKLLF